MIVTPPQFGEGTGVRVHLSLSVPLTDETGREVEFIYYGDSIEVHPDRWAAFREQYPALAQAAEGRA